MNLLPSLLLTLGLALTLIYSVLSEESLGSPYIQSALEEAKRIVDDAYKYSREKSLTRVRSESVKPSDVLRLYKQPRRDTRSAVRAADYMENTLRLIKANVHHAHKRSINLINATDILSDQDLETIATMTGCAARVRPPSCRTTPNINKYRTATSVCNNLNNPFFGASNTPFTRLLPAQYDDGVSEPIGWDQNKTFNNFVLPLVREVSNLILNTTDEAVVSDQEFTHLVTLFGQWNDHDLTFTPFSPSIRSFSNGLDCDQSCERSEPCFPIPIPPRDPRIPSGPNNCIPVFRSAPVCGTGNTAYMFGGVSNKREQINALTAFLDLGQVYGSEEGLALELRNLTDDGGLMRVNTEFTDNGRELLPFTTLNGNMCATRKRITNDTNAREVPCFFAGDARVDENIALTSIHTLFVREHNRLARELRRINPHWDSETLYQEARKIQGAYAQILVFRDYLPHIVGPDVMNRKLGRYPGYNEAIDPSIANVFATAAYRFAHLAIQPLVFRVDTNLNENPNFPSVPLYEAFFTPWRVVFEGGVDPLLRGLIIRPAKLGTQDHMMVNALRDRLFQFVMHIALDLASLNMQRGRDHGLPGYNKWRRFCGLSEPKNLQELAQVLNNTELAYSLLQLYGTPANIDVWLGGVAEPFVRNGRVGPLFACLIANQFKRIRQGDRLWYQNPGVFNSRQRASLTSVSLSRIICDNTDINMVPRDPFRIRSSSNPLVSCNRLLPLNLSPWTERACEPDCLQGPAGPQGPPGERGPEGMRGPPGHPGSNSNATQQHSAFAVRLGDTNHSSKKVIVFRQVIYNGQDHYNTRTGVFTCAVPGVYQFSYHCTSFITAGSIDLWLNGALELQGFQIFQNGRHTSTGDMVLQLAQGDQLWLEASLGNNGLSSTSFFSGHLLFTI
ncbi:eosinophil peroxidase-like [Osmerus eperlanus]|uniref:eosinophil peroxidase-like n=1 Tax=Osmerus eperlanus TaxID=29151 RepID=UPI002E15B73A